MYQWHGPSGRSFFAEATAMPEGNASNSARKEQSDGEELAPTSSTPTAHG